MKYTLLEEYDYDFTLIGISCHAKDYRICWSINQRFGYDFDQLTTRNLVLDWKFAVSKPTA